MLYLVVFNSARDVIKLDLKCRSRGLITKVVPVPEKYSSACGMSLELEDQYVQGLKDLAVELNIEVNIYEK